MNFTDKIVGKNQLDELKKNFKLAGKSIAFTNGCFDILHKGHVSYLAESSTKADLLFVGVNSDASVKRLGKGDDRPINDVNSRAYILSALTFIDFVIVFDEDTPFELIEEIEPQVLIKGGDYDDSETDINKEKYIVGANETKRRGGKVLTIPIVKGFSTTNLIEKMKSS